MKIHIALFCLILPLSLFHGSFQNLKAAEPEQEIVNNLKRLKETKECRECDLHGVNLNRAELIGADLERANLEGAKLYLCNLSGANLKDSILRNVGFGGADLSDADLRGADLTGTSLAGAYTHGAILNSRTEEDEEFAKEIEAILAKGESSITSTTAASSSEADSEIHNRDEEPGFASPPETAVKAAVVVSNEDSESAVIETIEKPPAPKKIKPITEVELD